MSHRCSPRNSLRLMSVFQGQLSICKKEISQYLSFGKYHGTSLCMCVCVSGARASINTKV